MSEVKCTYFPKCKGCALWDQTYAAQKESKIQHLTKLLSAPFEVLPEIEFRSAATFGLRHRFDFTVETHGEKQVMGLYGENRELVDLQICLQLSPKLQKVFEDFRTRAIRTEQRLIQKASVRLRVGPSELKGVWLDLANVDIKDLLEDQTYLISLLNAGYKVEMGQKAKSLKQIDGKLKLKDPEPHEWFLTQNASGQELPLQSYISDFTQPSWTTSRILSDVVLDWTKNKDIKHAIEFGPGVGQFTLPLLSAGVQVEAFENNPKAVEVLKLNAERHLLNSGLQISMGDFQNRSEYAFQQKNYDLALVNPPRSGLKNFVHTVIAAQAKFCIYISCFPESMAADLQQLLKSGHEIKAAKIVDQFPQTHHYESCVLLERLN